MTTPNAQVRRANVDDLQKLVALWKEENLPSDTYSHRFKDFQVVEDGEGNLIAAIGFAIQGGEGCLFGEAFAAQDRADECRDLIWQRAQIQAKNHGLVRVWTQLDAPFWHSNGLQPASEDALKKLPPPFAVDDPRPWTYIQLREESQNNLTIDQEFLIFKESEKANTERVMKQARVMKMIAGVVSVLVFILILAFAFFFMKLKDNPPPTP